MARVLILTVAFTLAAVGCADNKPPPQSAPDLPNQESSTKDKGKKGGRQSATAEMQNPK